jgi:hypothetical protein
MAQTVAVFGKPPVRQLVIVHVSMIDVDTGKALPDRNVVIKGDRITAVEDGAIKPEEGAIVIDGHGKFAIPRSLGYARASHGHYGMCLAPAGGDRNYNVRDMGGRLTQIDDWRSRIAAGILVGPHIIRVGWTLNGKSSNAFQMVPGGPEATRGAIACCSSSA